MTGILIVNLGTPDAPSRGAVYRYLKQFLLDPRVIDVNAIARNILVRGIIAPFRSGQSAKAYKKLWAIHGASPLKVYGERLVAGVQENLGSDYIVALGMRYQNPSIASALQQLLDAQVKKIVVFPLFPQYASASTGSVQEEVMRILSLRQVVPSVNFISTYPDHGPMIDIYADNARKFDPDTYDHILFSYHGLPQRQLRKADDCNYCLKTADCCKTFSAVNQYCYSAQCYATTAAIAKRLNLPKDKYSVSFQSRLGADPWTQPYTIRTLESMAKERNIKKLLVLCPAFTSDCLETTIEISDEYREEFLEWGGTQLDLVPSLNDNPAWIKVVADMVR